MDATGINFSPLNLPTAPGKITSRLIELLADANLTLSEVDEKIMMEFPILVEEGWTIGSTRQKLKKYPILARSAAEARALLWREVGRSKVDGYKVISDAMDAEKIAMDGTTTPDHDTRMKAADRMLTLMGESVNPAGAKMNISVNGDSAKILIMSPDGKPMPFPMRDKPADNLSAPEASRGN